MKSRSISGVEKLREQVDVLDEHIEKLEKQREKTISSMHSRCKHPDDQVIEAQYAELGQGYCLKPFRVCKLCGYAEEGWGCGYWKLNLDYREVSSVTREYAQRYVIRLYSQEKLIEMRRNK